MKENSLVLGSVALALTVPTALLTTSEYKKHKLTYEIVRLKRVKSFLKKGINILEDTSVEEFNKEKCL